MPEWWLLVEALWDPMSLAFKWAFGIAMGIKGFTMGLLWCLERAKVVPKRKKAQDQGGDEADAPTSERDAKKGQ